MSRKLEFTDSFRDQIRRNAVALISLVIAVSSLGYNTWRNETTEQQRNIRHAAFTSLEALGEFEQIVLQRGYFDRAEMSQAAEAQQRVTGYGQAFLIRDLTSLLPPPAPGAGEALLSDCNQQVDRLTAAGGARAQAREQLDGSVETTRESILQVLRSLD